MEPVTMILGIISIVSEILPLIGCLRFNGVLHGLHSFIIHISTDSACHIDISSSEPIPSEEIKI
jgi:uncharacterized membrane protein YkgB